MSVTHTELSELTVTSCDTIRHGNTIPLSIWKTQGTDSKMKLHQRILPFY